MKNMTYAAMLFSLVIAGCSSEAGKSAAENSDSKSASQTKPGSGANQPAAIKPAAGEGKEVALSPDNTKIQFVGNHVGADPMPRTGTFSAFSGKASINKDKLTSLQVDIETSSLSTEIEKLTNHLKSADFFDVREHPKATFQSTAIEADGDQTKITGDLTLLGVTKSISFPASVSIQDGLTLEAAFKIDRTQFGMNFGLDNVEKEVEMTVTVGG